MSTSDFHTRRPLATVGALVLLLAITSTKTTSDNAAMASDVSPPPPHPSSSTSAPPPPPLIQWRQQQQALKRDLRQEAPTTMRPARPACQVNSGESVAIVEIEESRGSDMSQTTLPLELPISGSPADVELKIESETHKYFHIQDKRLRLTRPLDRDAVLKQNASSPQFIQQQPITSIYLQVSCQDKRDPKAKKVIIPVLVKVLDLNDNAPKFSAPLYAVQVDELAPVGTVVFTDQQIQAYDLDSAQNGLIEYSLLGVQQQQAASNAPRLIQRTPATTTTTTTTTMATTTSAASSSAEPTTTTSTSTTLAPTTTTVLPSTSSTRPSEPSINLNNEPIVNGPVEEEEESDEALLAAMNSTDTGGGGDSDDPDSPMMLVRRSGLPKLPKRRRRRSAPFFRRRMFNEQQEASLLKPRDGLWTNLLTPAALEEQQQPATYAPTYLPRDAAAQSLAASEFFALELSPQTNLPLIRLKKPLDYESKRLHQLVLVATDRASNKSERLSSTTTLVVRVLDGDDQGPAFVLDQQGCATNSLPTATTQSVSMTTTAKPLRRKRSSAELDAADQTVTTRVAPNVPKGFKVTEENFDFSDSLPASLPEGAEEPLETNTGVRIKPPPASPLSMSPPVLNQNQDQKEVTAYSCLPLNSLSGQAEYFATVMSGDSDYVLRVAPQAIRARDLDELNSPIRYSFINGTPANYSAYFHINPLDATIKQVAPLERRHISRLQVWVEAQEQSANRLASVAKLTIEVVPSDKSPPVLVPNSYAGQVEENSPLGTLVSTAGRQPLRISVISAEGGMDAASYEFETTSEAFKVNKEGHLYVNRWPLDRDAPHQAVHMFQVTARQAGLVAQARSVSSPISLNVTLLDLNDNPPAINNSSLLPLQMQAGGSNGTARSVTFIQALDLDEGDNARAHFYLRHVSNNGRDRFRINETSGELEALGRFATGEQFSLTLQVADEQGRSSQGILELTVVPGANTGGPQFVAAAEGVGVGVATGTSSEGSSGRLGYAIEVSEGVAPPAAVLQVRAVDPENDPITYSLVGGNVNEDFQLNAKTGVLSVAKRLDREEVSGYSLLVQARDSHGLASTRPIAVTITDQNDQNPVFASTGYTFAVEEGQQAVGRILGRVLAHDGDAGDNGQVSYHLLEPSKLFSIDEKTGDLRLEAALDFEKTKSHSLVVSARDHGETPRTTTVGIQVRVIDQQDEAPQFERYFWEQRLPENLAHQRVGQVVARDLDSVAQITYVLRAGDPSLFVVDPQTGVVTTTRGLDYEESTKHTLLIGTLENPPADLSEAAKRLASSLESQDGNQNQPICRIDVHVQDLNDNAPQFLVAPLPVRVPDTVQPGHLVTRVSAQDADGSQPNNQVRYELVTRGNLEGSAKPEEAGLGATSERCAQSFMVEPSSGNISVRWDLKRDAQSECQLIVRARDLGEPQSLSGLAQVTIYIDHLAEISPTTNIAFADSQFTVELEENAAPNSLVKVLPIVNKPKIHLPISCDIIQGNELGKFWTTSTQEDISESSGGGCELRTSRDPQKGQLDYERRQRFSLTIRLNTLGGHSKSHAQVQVNLLDQNDNGPVFPSVARYSHLTQNRFLAAVAQDAPSETQVLQLRATDADSPHSNGLISYELLNGSSELEGRFKVDAWDGMVRTARPVEDVAPGQLPMRLKILARDNPEAPAQSQEAVAELVVNLIEDKHRIALVLKDTPTGRALESKEEILAAIQARTGLISGLERAESLKLQRNGSLEADVSGTDFWFYLIEPGTLRIVPSDDQRVKDKLFEQRARQSLLDVLNQTLNLNKARLRLPYSLNGGLALAGRSPSNGNIQHSTSRLASSESIGSGLIWFGLSIAIISAIVIVYQCGCWSSNSARRQRSEKQLYLKTAALQQQFYQQQQQLTCPKRGGPMDPNPYLRGSSAFSTLQSQLTSSVANQLVQQLDQQQQQPQLSQFSQKEYETQMLKMSVLFDDSHSVDDQQQQQSSTGGYGGVNMEVRN